MKLVDCLKANPGKEVSSPDFISSYRQATCGEVKNAQTGRGWSPCLAMLESNTWDVKETWVEVDADRAIAALRRKEIIRRNREELKLNDWGMSYRMIGAERWEKADFSPWQLLNGQGSWEVKG